MGLAIPAAGIGIVLLVEMKADGGGIGAGVAR